MVEMTKFSALSEKIVGRASVPRDRLIMNLAAVPEKGKLRRQTT
jgi:hypothetical protein